MSSGHSGLNPGCESPRFAIELRAAHDLITVDPSFPEGGKAESQITPKYAFGIPEKHARSSQNRYPKERDRSSKKPKVETGHTRLTPAKRREACHQTIDSAPINTYI